MEFNARYYSYLSITAEDPCSSNPCVTGNCNNLGNGQFICDCLRFEGWRGARCDIGNVEATQKFN